MKRYAIILAAFAIIATSCGGDDDPAGVPSLEGTDTSVTSTTAAQLDSESALLVFSECMRDEGIDLPDIGLDAQGAPALDPALLERIDIESDEFERAFEICQPILAQSEAFNIDIDPALLAQIEDQLYAFSQCMRDNGFEDFPDPTSLESGQPYPLSVLSQFSDPEFEAAVEVCQRGFAFPGLGG